MNLNKLNGQRIECGFTQKDMAEKLKITNVSYSNKETGKSEFTATEVSTLCKILHAEASELLN